MATDEVLQAKFAVLKPLLDERLQRIWAGVAARAIGRGGITQVARATGSPACWQAWSGTWNR